MINNDAALNDDAAVDRFAAQMKAKLALARANGRGGWQECDNSLFSAMFAEHLFKDNDGNLIDLANLLMFYQYLNGDTTGLLEKVSEKILAISTQKPDQVLVFNINVDDIPPSNRFKVLDQLKIRLTKLKEDLGLSSIIVSNHSGLSHIGVKTVSKEMMKND